MILIVILWALQIISTKYFLDDIEDDKNMCKYE